MQERDVDVLARTIWADARGEGVAGQAAVGLLAAGFPDAERRPTAP